MVTHYIGADVDSKMTNFAVERQGQIVKEYCVATTISAWRKVLALIPGKKKLAIEEGTMAGWLYRNIKDDVDEFTVCDPRRNSLIHDDGDKTDPLDARKLAELLRGGYLREVYHSDDEDRVLFKHWVSLYHDRVKDAVRTGNKLRDRCRLYGLKVPRIIFTRPERRGAWLGSLDQRVRKQLEVLFIGFDAQRTQVKLAKAQLKTMSRGYPIIDFWSELPGMGLIRAMTLFVYVDTPWRFKSPKKLWKYCGVGLQVTSSGKDKNGRPKQGKLQLAWAVNRRLKNVMMGAALSAIRHKTNGFRDYYERLLRKGATRANARHAVARKMLSVMWGMWKTNRRFDPALAFGNAN
jgi:transposase